MSCEGCRQARRPEDAPRCGAEAAGHPGPFDHTLASWGDSFKGRELPLALATGERGGSFLSGGRQSETPALVL
jgi:hypothetical protein